MYLTITSTFVLPTNINCDQMDRSSKFK